MCAAPGWSRLLLRGIKQDLSFSSMCRWASGDSLLLSSDQGSAMGAAALSSASAVLQAHIPKDTQPTGKAQRLQSHKAVCKISG